MSANSTPILPPAGPKRGIPSSALYTGSRFTGHLQSNGHCYQAEVILESVDETNDELCGSLMVKGLQNDYPSLTTFFQGEIIGAKNPFLRRNKFCNEEEKMDRKYWSKFPWFYHFDWDSFQYDKLHTCTYSFMRWKEHTAHGFMDILGTYYISLQKSTGTIDGYYYQKNSQLFQSLVLIHKPQRTIQMYEFR